MSAIAGIRLVTNYSSGSPATQQPEANQPAFVGGHAALVITATSYPTTTKLQFVPRSGVAIDIVTITTNGVYILDLPSGQYQLFMNAGTATAMYADLVTVPYS